MKNKVTKRVSHSGTRVAFLLSLLLLLAACTDELVPQQGEEYCPEGEPASVTLSWDVAGQPQLTRGLSETEESQVNDLWVGVYNFHTGERTYSFFTDDVDHNDQETPHQLSLNGLKAGESYIVAVANPKSIYGIMDGHPEKTFTGSDGNEYYNVYNVETGTAYWKEETNLADIQGVTARPRLTVLMLLEMADTWESYKSISTLLLTPGVVTRTSANFPMSGFYSKHSASDHDKIEKWFEDYGDCPETVKIYPGVNNLTGCIHLRRVTAHCTFNIKAGENVNVKPLSWQVVNVPNLSSLAERAKSIGDTSEGLLQRSEYGHKNYASSGTSAKFDTSGSVSTFDFYLNANKRTGLNTVTKYEDREVEYKEDDMDEGGNLIGTKTNSGIYQSLVTQEDYNAYKNDPTKYPANNYATYVVLTCDVDYWYDTQVTDGNGNPTYAPVDMTKITDNSNSRYLHRTGTGIYTIHLGYCEGEGAEKARDFKVCRNTKYTYNVTINSIDNIRVEAISDQEQQPGQEGIVSDLASTIYNLDCHYCVFNIKLSYSDRTNLGYVIQTFENGKEWYYEHTSETDDNAPTTEGIGTGYVFVSGFHYQGETNGRPYPKDVVAQKRMHFWDWIEFHPTIAEDKLAPYPPTSPEVSEKAKELKNRPWNLAMLSQPETYKAIDANGNEVEYSATDETEYWYTVFINENVYYYDYGGGSNLDSDGAVAKWWLFTKQPDRRIWLISKDDAETSPDQESKYIKAKYLINQKSIDTYYSTEEYDDAIPNVSPSAVGCEHENESFGQPMRWCSNLFIENLDNSNGRWNTWLAFGQSENTEWSSIAKYENGWMKPLTILSKSEYTDNNYNSKVNTTGSNIIKPTFEMQSEYIAGAQHGGDVFRTNYFYDPIKQCMSRNRDLNGDGKINANEIRWYLPATRMYLRLMIGESSLDEPFWNFSQTQFTVASGAETNGFSHYVTSNAQFIWAEEGMSLMNITAKTGSGGHDAAFWQIRCVRNLGADISAVVQNSSMQPAYTKYQKANGNWVFTMQYYDKINNRLETSVAISPHKVNDSRNMTAYRFEIASGDLKDENGNYVENTNHVSLIENNNCNVLNKNGETGWRIPNYQELCLIMLLQNNAEVNLGLNSGYRYASCTQEYYGSRVLELCWRGSQWASTADNEGTARIRCVRDVIEQ